MKVTFFGNRQRCVYIIDDYGRQLLLADNMIASGTRKASTRDVDWARINPTIIRVGLKKRLKAM